MKEFLKNLYKLILGIYSFIVTLIWNKKSVEHAKTTQINNHLKKKVNKIEEKSQKILNNQRDQAKVSAYISMDRNKLHNWLQEHRQRCGNRDRKN